MKNNISELLKEKVISQETANNILKYYQNKNSNHQSKLFIFFGILGALLLGLGIFLIIGHNWDLIPKTVRVSLVISLLVLSQILCGYLLISGKLSIWKDSLSTFLFLSVGACLILISQIYHTSGDLTFFLIVWMSLCAPIFYLLNSSFVFLLYLIGISSAFIANISSIIAADLYTHLSLFLVSIPYYSYLLKRKSYSLIMFFVNIVLVAHIVYSSIYFLSYYDSHFSVFYFMLLSVLFINIKEIKFLKDYYSTDKVFSISGYLILSFLLFMKSSNLFWLNESEDSNPIFITLMLILFLISGTTLYLKYKKTNSFLSNPINYSVLALPIAYTINFYSNYASAIFISFFILIISIIYILDGLKSKKIRVFNFGVILLFLLIILRFIDEEYPYWTKGLVFFFIGILFVLTNYLLIQKVKKLENEK